MRAATFLLLAIPAVLANGEATNATAAADSSNVKGTNDTDVGNWTVGDCILAQFAMQFELHANASSPNTTTSTVTVPPTARADSQAHNCGNHTQDLNLFWTERARNDSSVLLARNLTITFGRKNTTLYGVERLYGNFEMARFPFFDPKSNETINATSVVSVGTGDVSVLMFKVGFKRSFLCADLGAWTLTSSLKYSFSDKPLGTQMPNATISTSKVQFDAFRSKESPPGYFRSPEDCDYAGNDIVPIVVGVALAGVVVFVLCAYMYGRRKHRQRGYQSV